MENTVEMPQQQVDEWQKYLVSHGISQPFEQLWEPVFATDIPNELKRITGFILSASERNELKKHLISKGIEVHSDPTESYFDHRAYAYVYADTNTMHFGKYISIDYKINGDKSIELKTSLLRTTPIYAR